MKKVSTCLVSILVYSLLLLGCSDGENGNTGTPGNQKTVLENAWVGQCSEVIEGSFSGSRLWTDVYSNNVITSIYELYSSQYCTGSPSLIKKMIGTFTIGNSFVSANGLQAEEIDFQINSVTVEGAIDGLNPDNLGFNSGANYYDIFYLNDNTLYYGNSNTGNGSSPTERANEIDFANVWSMQ